MIAMWAAFVGIFPGLIISTAMGTIKIPSWTNIGLMTIIGCTSYLGLILAVSALKVNLKKCFEIKIYILKPFQFEEAGTISLVRKAEDILVSFFIQIAYFEEIPCSLSLIGAAVITVCVILSGLRKIIERKSETKWLRRVLCLPLEKKAKRKQSVVEAVTVGKVLKDGAEGLEKAGEKLLNEEIEDEEEEAKENEAEIFVR